LLSDLTVAERHSWIFNTNYVRDIPAYRHGPRETELGFSERAAKR
jgi:hypothetical protein